MITFLIFAGSVLVLVGLHEVGHFLAAKVFGVYVIEFAVGFGPKLFSFSGRETRYSIRAIPVGGYVRMAGENRRESGETIPTERFLYNKRPYVRILISLAGPAANLVLALAVTVAVVWATSFPILQVADVIPETPAAVALAPGDRILGMNGRQIYTVAQFTSAVQRSVGRSIAVDLVRDEVSVQLSLTPTYSAEEERYIVGAYIQPIAFTNEITSVSETSPLGLAGVRTKDRIVAVDGEKVGTAVAFVVTLDELLPADGVALSVVRGGERFDVALPTAGRTIEDLLLDVQFADLGIDYHRAGFLDGLVLGAGQFAVYTRMLADVVRGIITGRVAASEALQGPVGVARTLKEGLRLGPAVFFQILAFLSLNFGLLNLVPFPGLDGSRAGFALYEWVRGKPIPPEREGVIHAIGFLVLIGLMLLITYKDLIRLFR